MDGDHGAQLQSSEKFSWATCHGFSLLAAYRLNVHYSRVVAFLSSDLREKQSSGLR